MQELAIGQDMYEDERDGEDLVDVFRAHCPNVMSLSVQEKGCFWVDKFGTQLEKLELRTRSVWKFYLSA